jgi:hypothetical protein
MPMLSFHYATMLRYFLISHFRHHFHAIGFQLSFAACHISAAFHLFTLCRFADMLLVFSLLAAAYAMPLILMLPVIFFFRHYLLMAEFRHTALFRRRR